MQSDNPTLPPGPSDAAALSALRYMARIKRESAQRAEENRERVLAALEAEQTRGAA